MVSGGFWLGSGGFGSFLAGFGWFQVLSITTIFFPAKKKIKTVA